MKDEDVKRLLNCRGAIDKHQADRINFRSGTDDHKNSVEKYMKVLNDNGFVDVSAFIVFNEQMCKEIFLATIIITGTCEKEKCREFSKGDTPCQKKYGNPCLFTEMLSLDDVKLLAWNKYRSGGTTLDTHEIKGEEGGCPIDIGWHFGGYIENNYPSFKWKL